MDGRGELCCGVDLRALTITHEDGGGDMTESCKPWYPGTNGKADEDKVAAIANQDEIQAAALYTNPTVVYREFLQVASAFELREIEKRILVQELDDLKTKMKCSNGEGQSTQSTLTVDVEHQPDIDIDERSAAAEEFGETLSEFDDNAEEIVCTKVNPEKLDLELIVCISQLKERPNTIFEGKIFICSCVAIPRISDDPNDDELYSYIALVTDQHGKDVVFLESSSIGRVAFVRKGLIKLLSRACVIMVNNPIFTKTVHGRYSIVFDDLYCLTFLTDAVFKELLPGFTWTPLDVQPKDLASKENYDDKLSKDWAYLGNRYFIQKNYMLALDCYNISNRLNPYDLDVLVHRSAAFNLMGVYSAALTDAEKALKIESSNLKAINRKTKALCCLRKYDEAIKFLESLLMQSNNEKKRLIEGLLEQCKALLSQHITGEYDWMKLYQNPGKRVEDQAEFLGSVKLSTNSEGAKGVYATNDFKRGQLIMAVRAFAAVVHEDSSSFEWGSNGSKVENLAANVVSKVKYDTGEARQEFFELPVGSLPEVLDKQVDDLLQVLNICELNGFGVDYKCSDGCEPMEFKKAAFGIWILPSYIRHSCLEANSIWRTCGDFLFVRAISDIATGEEIKFPFGDITAPLPIRKKIFNSLGQSCGCRLCRLDERDSVETQHQRAEIVADIARILSNTVSNDQDVNKLLSKVAALERLRSENPKMNFALLDPLQIIGMAYYTQGKHKQAIAYFERVFNMAKGTPLIGILVYMTLNLAIVNVKAGHIHQAKKWMKILKKYLMIGFGCIEVVEMISKDAAELMKEHGISILS